jgi:hypothetical protein
VLAAALMVSAAASADRGDVTNDVDVVELEPHDRIFKIASKFRGSIFLFDQSISPETFPGAQQSDMPSYQWWLSFRPRYYFLPNLSLRVRMDLTLEWLNAVDTTLEREPLFGDLWTDLVYNPRPFWKGRIEPSVGLRAVWGTSKDSIAAGQVAKIGVTGSLVSTFSLRRAGALELSLGMYALYGADTHTSAGTLTSYGCSSVEGFNAMTCTENTGLMNAEWSLVALPSIKYSPHPKVSIGVTYAVLDTWAYQTPNLTANGQTIPRAADDTRFRQSGWFLASVDYDPRDWIELSIGYYCLRPILDPDGTYGNPFWKPGGSARIFLTTTFNLDRVYDAAARRIARHKAQSVASSAGSGLSASF